MSDQDRSAPPVSWSERVEFLSMLGVAMIAAGILLGTVGAVAHVVHDWWMR